MLREALALDFAGRWSFFKLFVAVVQIHYTSARLDKFSRDECSGCNQRPDKETGYGQLPRSPLRLLEATPRQLLTYFQTASVNFVCFYIQHVLFCVWLPWLPILFVRFIRVVCNCISFTPIAMQNLNV